MLHTCLRCGEASDVGSDCDLSRRYGGDRDDLQNAAALDAIHPAVYMSHQLCNHTAKNT